MVGTLAMKICTHLCGHGQNLACADEVLNYDTCLLVVILQHTEYYNHTNALLDSYTCILLRINFQTQYLNP